MSKMASDPEAQLLTDPTQRRFRGSAKISEYEVMQEKLGEGTFGVVSKAKSKRTGKLVALKKILMHNEKDGFPITALREVKLLKLLSHPNILKLDEMAVERQPQDEKGKSGKKRATLYMVMQYMDHDLSGMLTNPNIHFTPPQIKCYMQQLLEGVRYLHDSHILHRDMKAANILISNKGMLQIADFGLARHYDGPTPQPGRGSGDATRDYTSLVVTRWYRPPELLLTLKRYTPAIDMWGVGCVFGEMWEHKPILEGKTDVDQCHRIFKLVGSPNDQNMPGWSDLPGCEGTRQWEFQRGDIDQRFGAFKQLGPEGLDLLKKLMCLDWRKRINAIDALQHEYFTTAPLPIRPEDIPQYEDSHELDSRRRGHEKQRALPPAPAGGTVGMGPNEHGSYQNGYNDRGARPHARDRGPPGLPPARYDDRRRGPPSADASRAPAWRDRDRAAVAPPPTNGYHLPPRPPVDLPPRPDIPARGPPPPARGSDRSSDRGAAVDTYIPSYQTHDRAQPPQARDYDRSNRGSQELNYRDPDRQRYRDADAPRDRPSYRDADAPPYRDRERDRERGFDGQRRTRSRSPDRRQRASEGAGRERAQDRDRDLYRR